MSKLSNIIRNPKVIAQYIKGVYDARRDKEKTYHLAFNREANGGWYIDLPEWEGAHAQLAMVAGADDLLEFVGKGAPRVEVTVVKSSETVPELDSDPRFFRCDALSCNPVGGATYDVRLKGFNRTMWLCPVTLFVLGEYPRHLYIARELKNEKTTDETSNRITPDNVSLLGEHEIFVFGSNIHGSHGGGAARYAMQRFGAVWGQGEGLQGRSYAIPTMEGLQSMTEAVGRFTHFATSHPELHFLVTRIGCGIAGYRDRDVAPLFRQCIELQNVSLPAEFWEVLGHTK